MRRSLLVVSLITVSLARGAEPLPGHSSHGEAFNEGPRQAAVLIEGCGKVHFPVTSSNTEVQRFFDQGVGQLHGFWYYEAERSFRQVILLDPDCAMAYWGCAMANVNNETRATAFIAEAKKRSEKASKREQAWIEALNQFYADLKKDKKQRHLDFIKATESMVHDNPDDLEAKAFLAWAIWKAKDADLPMVSREAVDALISQVLAKEPMHPAHHYRIHLWDDGKASRALPSAAMCGQSAPAIAHMWHMPGHTFSKTGRLADSLWQQRAAHRVDNAYIYRTRLLPDQIHNYAHNAEWLVRTHQQLGHANEALLLAKNMIKMPRHPDDNSLEKENSNASYGRTRLLETLLLFGLWEQVQEMENSPLLDKTFNPSHEAAKLRALGIAAFFLNDETKLNQYVIQLKALKKTTPKVADGKNQDDKKKKELPLHLRALNELEILKAIADGGKAKDITPKLDTKDIPKDRLVRYHLRLGNQEQAIKLANELPFDNAVLQALKVDVLMTCGKKDAAKAAFEALRKTAATMDTELPSSLRLDAIATELGIPAPWRSPEPAKEDSGVRPEIETLGPLYWSPVKAPISYEKPTLVIFYINGGCSHCMKQLKKFQETASEFNNAGINLLAIGNETREEQSATTLKTIFGSKDANIELESDQNLEKFKAWRCHDDFEGAPLHGVFLVDKDGFIRWQDISHEPFANTKFLLNEAKRLLSLPSSK